MEKRVLKIVLKEEQNNIQTLQAKNKTQKADSAKRLTTTKKFYMKQKQNAIQKIQKLLKKNLTEKNKNEKQIKREEMKLRKTLRKQNRIQEEMKNEFVKGLVTKYSNKIDDDLKIIESTVTDAEREKEEAKAAKKLEQQLRKLEREQQKEFKEKVKEAKQKQKEQVKEAKQKQKEQAKEAKPKQKPSIIKTKRITKLPIKSSLLANVMKKRKPVTKKNLEKIQELKHTNNIEDKYDTTTF
jgi:chromatin assembly factor 1 subunit A